MTNSEQEFVVENKTEADAHLRVLQARTGSGVDATITFKVALRAKLYCWIADLDADLALSIHRANRLLAAEES